MTATAVAEAPVSAATPMSFELMDEPTGRSLPAAPRAAAITAITTPSDLLRIAAERGDADLDRLERLMKMHLEWRAEEAKNAFFEGMAGFKAEPIKIFKRKEVYFQSQKGVTNYWHAELSDVTDAVGPAMARHGLTFDWDIRQEPGRVIVDCIITHKMGYSKKVTMEGPLDATGNKNAIQQAGSTVTYLQRYTLLAAIGMATQGMDNDGGDNQIGSDEHGDPAHDGARADDSVPAFYSQAKFDENKDAWRKLILAKKKTPAQVIATVESKGARMTDAQKNTIDSWSHEND